MSGEVYGGIIPFENVPLTIVFDIRLFLLYSKHGILMRYFQK